MVRIGQTKNNIENLLQLYAFTKKKKKRARETVKIVQTKITVTFLIHFFYIWKYTRYFQCNFIL